MELRLYFEGIRRVMRLKPIQSERFISSLNIDVEISPGPPPQRLKDTMRAAIGIDIVHQANRLPVTDIVSIAFMLFLVIESFSVRQNHMRAFAARKKQLRIRGSQLRSI